MKPTETHTIPQSQNSARSQKKNEVSHREFLQDGFWTKIPAWQNVSEKDFYDSLWQMKNSITNLKQLKSTLHNLLDENFYKDVEQGLKNSPMAVRISPYVLSLIDWQNPYTDPLRKQFLPVASQQRSDHPEVHLDSLNEVNDSPVKGLTHRYPDKVLFLALDICPVYCRYCTRSYAIGTNTETVEKLKMAQDFERYKQMFKYISENPQIEDVVVSGGDAYMLKPDRLRLIGETLLNIPHIRRIRIATKGLAILPMKILTDLNWYKTLKDLVDFGRKNHKEVCVHTHFSHPNEITNITKLALDRMMEDSIPVRNQTVLQRGVNDNPETLILLNRKLSYLNVHPYYVYMHDLVKGVEDLRTTLQTGIDIEKYIRGSTAGFNTPTFVVDACGGGGKRVIHSFEYYSPETGIAIYSAPSVKPGKLFFYFDPLDELSTLVQKFWEDPKVREEMKESALQMAKR